MPHPQDDRPALTVRDAVDSDVARLCELKPGPAGHLDRIRDAKESSGFRYLVLLKDREIIGFACLVFTRPRHWSDADDRSHLPEIIDLQVSPPLRGRGYGTFFIGEIERLATAQGSRRLYITVNYPDNAAAYALYTRLGYRQLQPEPYLCCWKFTDSDGVVHRGEDWRVRMCKAI